MYCQYLIQQGFIEWIIQSHNNKETKFKLFKKIICYSKLTEEIVSNIFEFSILTLKQISEFQRIYSKDNGVACINKLLALDFINFPFLLDNGIANHICDNLCHITSASSIPFIQETAWFLKTEDCNQVLSCIITTEIKYLIQLFDETYDDQKTQKKVIETLRIFSSYDKNKLLEAKIFIFSSILKLITNIDNIELLIEIIDLCNQLLIGQLELLKYFPTFYKEIFVYVSEEPKFLSVTAKSYFIIEPFYKNDQQFLEIACQLIPLFVSHAEGEFKEKKIFTYYFGWLMKKLQLDSVILLFEDSSFLFNIIDIIIDVGESFDIDIIDTVLDILLFFWLFEIRII